MADSNAVLHEVFLDVFLALPRQGPGNRACTLQALDACVGLPDRPRVLDLGCGTGAQTLDLANAIDARILALDLSPRSVEQLRRLIASGGLGRNVVPVVGDMARIPAQADAFDLIWSEGALYSIGLTDALETCARYTRPGGYLAFTDAVWRAADPSSEARALFAVDSPGMGTPDETLALLGGAGFEPVEHFPLPHEAWWEGFYGPMNERIEELRRQHRGDGAVQLLLDELSREALVHRDHGSEYGYEFYVARRGG